MPVWEIHRTDSRKASEKKAIDKCMKSAEGDLCYYCYLYLWSDSSSVEHCPDMECVGIQEDSSVSQVLLRNMFKCITVTYAKNF